MSSGQFVIDGRPTLELYFATSDRRLLRVDASGNVVLDENDTEAIYLRWAHMEFIQADPAIASALAAVQAHARLHGHTLIETDMVYFD
jgi:hypothetical protein